MPKAPIPIGTILTLMFHNLFNSLARSFFSHYFSFILWSAGTASRQLCQFFFFFVIIILLLWEFFPSALAEGFPLEFEWQQIPTVSRIFLSILAHLNDVVWIVTSRPLICKSSSPFISPIETVPSAPITTGITVTFMFHCFFSPLASSCYLSFFSLSFNFTLLFTEIPKSTIRLVLFFLLLTINMPGRPAEIMQSVCISKSLRILCVSFSWTDSRLWIYHFFIWSNFNLLPNAQ